MEGKGRAVEGLSGAFGGAYLVMDGKQHYDSGEGYGDASVYAHDD